MHAIPIHSPRTLGESQFRSIIEEACLRFRPVGAGVAVVCGGQTFSFGMGSQVAGQSRPVTASTVFPIASCTKSFTAAIAARLVDCGVIQWDATIDSLLPHLRFNSSELTQTLTLRDLLSHRTGLERILFLEFGSTFTSEELLARLPCVTSSKPPRTTMTYTNIGYLAAGTALSAAAGSDWASLVSSLLFEPLGMRRSFSRFADSNHVEDLAQPHLQRDGKWQAFERLDRSAHAPASIIHASTDDMAAWLRFQLARGSGIVSEVAWMEMHAPQVARDLEATGQTGLFPFARSVSHGMGWNLYDDGSIRISQHSGEVLGYSSQMAIAPDHGFGAFVVNNSGDEAFSFYLLRRLLDACAGRDRDWTGFVPPAKEGEKPTASPTLLRTEVRRAMEGKYTNRCLGDLVVSSLEDALQFSFLRAPLFDFRVRPLVDGSWYAEMEDWRFGNQRGWNLDFGPGSVSGGASCDRLDLPEFGVFDRQ